MPGIGGMPGGRGRGGGGGRGRNHNNSFSSGGQPNKQNENHQDKNGGGGGGANSTANDATDETEAKDEDENEENSAALADGSANNEEPPKNLSSGQGSQLALPAVESSSPRKFHATAEKWDNLRQRLTTQLVTGKAECLICLEKIKPVHATWDCTSCYQVFHIHCKHDW